jgi:hypothetical protein
LASKEFLRLKIAWGGYLKKLQDFGEYQDHPDDQNDIENHSNMKKHVEELAVCEFISLLWFTHDSVHHQGG